jgi:hypothetical protein
MLTAVLAVVRACPAVKSAQVARFQDSAAAEFRVPSTAVVPSQPLEREFGDPNPCHNQPADGPRAGSSRKRPSTLVK